MGLNIMAFVWVKLKDMALYRHTGKDLAKLNQVMEVHNMAGEECFLLKVAARETKDLALILEAINQIDNVKATPQPTSPWTNTSKPCGCPGTELTGAG